MLKIKDKLDNNLIRIRRKIFFTWKIHGRLCNISTQANSFFGTQVKNAVPLSNNFRSIERLKSMSINDGIGPQLSFFVANTDGLELLR